jgi:hypothetical protein
MGVGDRHVERIAHDIDRARRDRRIDGGGAAVRHQRMMSLHEDEAVMLVGDEPLHLVTGAGDLPAMLLGRLEAEHIGEALLGDLPGREPAHGVDVLRIVLAVEQPGEIVQEGARPGVAGFWERGDPHDAGIRRGGFGGGRVAHRLGSLIASSICLSARYRMCPHTK